MLASLQEMSVITDKVQKKYGYEFDTFELEEIFRYTKRKSEIIGLCEEYIPILFENELRDYLTRLVVNCSCVTTQDIKNNMFVA